MDTSISNINTLITRLKGLEDQIQHNAKQPVHDYDRLIFDCQRILFELDQNLRVQVEQALNTGKRLYIPDNKDSSGIESADETGGGGSPLSSPLKTRSDLTLRKVRRHVLQLTQHWKNATNNIQHRLKLLQRIQTTVEEFRRRCDQLHAHLLEIELASVHKPQIKALNIEQIPAEIEQAKHLLTTLMSCKSAIDDIQQSAQTIEKEYDIQVVNRAQELQHRWEHSVSSISQRIQSLQESVKNTDSDIYAISVEYPWQRAVALNQIPYYINHSDQTTSWDHPKMLELMRSFSNYNHIRFSAYRTAMKLRTLQKRLCLDLTSLDDIRSIFEERPLDDLSNKTIDIKQILDCLQRIFEKTSREYPQLINVISTVDLTLNWLLNIYDTNRTGTIRLLSVKMALALLCRGNIEEKYRYVFSLISYEKNGQQVLDRQQLAILFQQAIVIPKQLGEVAAFGGSSVEPSVQSCFEYAHNPDVISIDDFLQWVKLEPQSLVWLPVMHRLAASEAAKHEARCNICKIYPMLGFRYRSLRHFNCDICQNCFFSGKQTKVFKMDHPLQEYYSETTSTEDIRDFFRIFKNKLWNRQRKNPKLGYLPLPYVFDNTISSNDQPSSPTPVLTSSLTTPFRSESEPSRTVSSPLQSDDEHGMIAQHCKNLNSAAYKSPRTVAHALLSQSTSLDTKQRHELEAIIHDLEDENHLLQNEYERLCQEHMEKSLIINEHHEQLHLNESPLDIYQDRTMLREAKQLRQHKSKLEQRMIILEEHNKQLEKQLQRSKQLLIHEFPTHQSNDRQTNLLTIDNLFHMADDINRAVGDLVSVITEPQ